MRFVSAALAATMLAFTAGAQDAPLAPACALLTADEAKTVLGGDTQVSDGGAEMMGMSSCSWVEMQNYNAVGVSLMQGEALAGQTADAYYDNFKSASTAGGAKTEDVSGVGDKAFLIDNTGGYFSLTAKKGDKIISLTGAGIAKEKVIEAATLMAGHL